MFFTLSFSSSFLFLCLYFLEKRQDATREKSSKKITIKDFHNSLSFLSLPLSLFLSKKKKIWAFAKTRTRQGVWWWSRAGASTGMTKKVQTTKERHFARKRTTLAFMRAIMREHRLSEPCCRKRERFLVPSKIVIFLNFARRKVERTVVREEAEDSAARSVRFIALVWRRFYFFLFFYSMKGYGAWCHYATPNYWGRLFFAWTYCCSCRVSSIDDNVTHNSQSISTARD